MLIKGQRYVVYYQLHGSPEPSKLIGDYMGSRYDGDDLLFDMRPKGGTAVLRKREVISARTVTEDAEL